MPSTREPAYVEAEINGQKVKVLLDTAGGSSVITESMANKLNLKFLAVPTAALPLKFKTISDTFESRDTFQAEISLKLADTTFNHRIFIPCGIQMLS